MPFAMAHEALHTDAFHTHFVMLLTSETNGTKSARRGTIRSYHVAIRRAPRGRRETPSPSMRPLSHSQHLPVYTRRPAARRRSLYLPWGPCVATRRARARACVCAARGGGGGVVPSIQIRFKHTSGVTHRSVPPRPDHQALLHLTPVHDPTPRREGAPRRRRRRRRELAALKRRRRDAPRQAAGRRQERRCLTTGSAACTGPSLVHHLSSIIREG